MNNQFQTPHDVVKYMVNMLPPDISTVLEPTPGVGNIYYECKQRDYDVTAPQDYFLLDKSLSFDAIVMNPPFSKKSLIIDNAPVEYQNIKGMAVGYKILFECMQKSDVVIALMPWYTISDYDVRMRAIKKFGLKSITALPRKTFKYARIQTCILELRKGWREPTNFYVYELMVNGKEYIEKQISNLQ